MNKKERIEKAIRNAVISYMSWSGANYRKLCPNEWNAVYLLGDGFGQVDRKWAEEQCWDWSHVRDSSPEALARMWDAICHYESKREAVAS